MVDRVEGNVVTFSTLDRVLEMTTGDATERTNESATLSGSVDAMDGYDIVDCSIQYRETGATTWLETAAETRETTGSFSAAVDGLETETEYEYRARGVGAAGDDETEAVGETEVFETTPPQWQTHVANEGHDEESELYVYEAEAAGPVTMAINIHASERPAIDALEGMLDQWEYPVDSGTLIVWPAPCPSAEEEETLTCNGEDLNEAFDLGDGPQTDVAQAIEDELVEWDVEHLCDLHTRSTLYEDGGEANAVFPSDDADTRPISNTVVDHINANYEYEPDEEWQVGNNIDESGAENDGMLATYAWEIHDVHSQIGISWSSWNDGEQTDQLQRFVAVTLDESGHDLRDAANTLE
jgi:hypothetical protein